MSSPTNTRPVLEAAETEAKNIMNGEAFTPAAMVALAGYFGLSAATGNLVVALLGLLPGVITYIGTVIGQAQAAYRVWQNSEHQVTPIVAPRDSDGAPLIAAVGGNGPVR